MLGLIKFLELLTALIGTIYYKKYFNSYLKYLLALLWLSALVEFCMWALKHYGIYNHNNFVYNILTSLQYVYYFTFYQKLLKTDRYKRLISTFMKLFIASVTVNFLFFQKLTVTAAFHSYTFALGAILLIITIGLFFAEILNSEKVLYFTRYLPFWISIGLFVFYTGIIPFIIYLNLLPDFLSGDSLEILFFTLNLPLYIFFILGFILSDKYTDK